MTLLRILFFGRIGSTKLVLPKWQNIDILNRDNRVKPRTFTFLGRTPIYGNSDCALHNNYLAINKLCKLQSN